MESPSELSDHESPSEVSAGSETCSSGDENDRHCKAEGNAGMADVIAKMLSKPVVEDKPVILAKHKSKHVEESKAEAKRKKLAAAVNKDWEEHQHVLPALARTELDRRLQSIATKGVVKLFNAVSKHQKEVKAKLKEAPTEAKREKVVASISQDNFLEMLRSSNTMVTGSIARKKAPAAESSSDDDEDEDDKDSAADEDTSDDSGDEAMSDGSDEDEDNTEDENDSDDDDDDDDDDEDSDSDE